ncbi:MAG: hypothetical protein NUV77_06995 [Thermoguttaceae bacterium]|jgi:hypothetical protein|nr:hypothetical protein [Thermoguttaceae bacterium]
MSQPVRFADVLESVDRLPPEDQEALADILRRRLAQRARARIADDVLESRKDFAAGRCRATTPEELVREALS